MYLHELAPAPGSKKSRVRVVKAKKVRNPVVAG